MDNFFGNCFYWLDTLIGFVWNNILSIKVGGAKLYIWALGIIIIGGAFSLVFRFKPHAPDAESGLRSLRSASARRSEASSRVSRGPGSSSNIRHRRSVD